MQDDVWAHLRRRLEASTTAFKIAAVTAGVATFICIVQIMVVPKGHWTFLRLTVPLAVVTMVAAVVAEFIRNRTLRAIRRAERELEDGFR